MRDISRHLSYGEATQSNTAKARGIKNEPPHTVLLNMCHVAETVFEKARLHFGGPLFVSSFYRSPELNKAIGGSATSQHCKGEAMDIDGDVYPTATNKQVFEFIKDHCDFDQLIVEGIEGGKIAWVHVSSKKNGNRKKILFMYKSGGRTVYENYSQARYKQLVY
jgi:zinc D-Ala-D-Ala carboxypeptidase